MTITLLGRPGCHLCDDAEALLVGAGHAVDRVNIDDDDALVGAYGLRIPVLLDDEGTVLAEGLITAADVAEL
ncbi:MAG: glutaredoxin family protein [Acidimicrobiia bacterium]|nr:glutaredoxin family protein [Acidimicrobiia bacterium]